MSRHGGAIRIFYDGELGIQEPVILCEPQILTVNRWLLERLTVEMKDLWILAKDKGKVLDSFPTVFSSWPSDNTAVAPVRSVRFRSRHRNTISFLLSSFLLTGAYCKFKDLGASKRRKWRWKKGKPRFLVNISAGPADLLFRAGRYMQRLWLQKKLRLRQGFMDLGGTNFSVFILFHRRSNACKKNRIKEEIEKLKGKRKKIN